MKQMNPEMDDTIAEYFRFLLYSEIPGSQLRKPLAHRQEAERVAIAMIELLALIDATQFDYDHAAVALRLQRIEQRDIDRFDNALIATGATRQRRLLALVRRELIESVAALDPVERQTVVAARIAAYERALTKAKFEIDADELQHRLGIFLEANQRPIPPLPPPEAPGTSAIAPAAPRSSLSASAGIAGRHVILLRDEQATQVFLDAWLQICADAEHFDASGRTSAASWAEIEHYSKTRCWGPLANAVVGELRECASVPDYLGRHWLFGRDQPPAEALDRIAGSFRWALFQWNSVMREDILAFVSDDDAVVAGFEALRHKHKITPVSAFHHAERLPGIAHGLSFRECDAFGEAALIAAASDGCAPWLVLCAHDHPSHWWRAITARMEPLVWHWALEFGRPLLLLAYRVHDAAAWRELWSHLGHDNNVAVAAVCGRVAADALRERLVLLKDSMSVDNLRCLAGDRGWAYGHVWGGGSDEHVAVFFAVDPTVTSRVAAFARGQWPDLAHSHAYW